MKRERGGGRGGRKEGIMLACSTDKQEEGGYTERETRRSFTLNQDCSFWTWEKTRHSGFAFLSPPLVLLVRRGSVQGQGHHCACPFPFWVRSRNELMENLLGLIQLVYHANQPACTCLVQDSWGSRPSSSTGQPLRISEQTSIGCSPDSLLQVQCCTVLDLAPTMDRLWQIACRRH